MRLRLTRDGLLAVTAVFLLFMLATAIAAALRPGFRHEDAGMAIGAILAYWGITYLGIGFLWLLRKRRTELLLMLGALAFVYALTEAAVYCFLPERAMLRFRWEDSRKYHHIAPPGRTMFKTYYEGHPIFIRTNEDGLRTAYSRTAFLQCKERVVIMGDSFPFGFGVRQEYALPEVVQQLLRERLHRTDIGVLNAAIVSYSPFLANLLYAGVIKEYKPDLVLYFLDATDFGDDYFYAAQAKHDGDRVYFDVAEHPSRYYGAIPELLRRIFAQPLPQKALHVLAYPQEFFRKHIQAKNANDQRAYYDFSLYIDGVPQTTRYFIYKHPPDKLAPFFNATLDNVNRLAKQVQDSGAAFILVVLPRFQHWNPKESPNYWEKNEYSVNEPYQFAYLDFFDNAQGRLTYPMFNLLPAFRATTEYPLTFEKDAHWNERGHAFVARVITEYLLGKGFVK